MISLRTFLDRQRLRRQLNVQQLLTRSLCSGATLTLLLATAVPQHVRADDPAPDSEAAKQAAAELQKVLEQADASVDLTEKNLSEQVTQDAVADLATAPAGEKKTSLIKRVTEILTSDEKFSDARGVAISDDNADQTEKARTLVLIAKAERASGQPAQAWFTLHEAQQIALTLTDPESVVGVFREIGAVEHELIQDARKQGRSTFGTLDPKSGEVIDAVLDFGLPPEGYNEIEILRTGGGPLREPTIVRHQYFYNGDRFFQGPNLRGGQTIIQAVHPVTQCLTQCHVTLPAGTPIVTCTEHQIRYLYPEVAVVLDFEHDGDVELNYRQKLNPHKRLQKKLIGGSKTGRLQIPDSGTTSTLSNALRIGVGNPLELTTRLPVLSDLVNRKNRIPGSLTSPK
ncbi:hypothetical protein GC176_14660 [bacterium]|nr:hypothetical protein [bacterium]